MATDTRRRSSRRGTKRRIAVAAALTVTLVGGACAQAADEPDVATGVEVGEFAATPEYLADVVDAADGLAYRMSMDVTMVIEAEGQSLDLGGTFMTGEVDGERYALTMDMGELFRDTAAQAPPGDDRLDELLDGDLTMEMVTDGSTLYMRAPFFATLGEMALDAGASPADLGPLDGLVALRDQWGRIDLAEVSPSQVASAAGIQTSDPRAVLDMVSQGTDVHELGSETIGGVETRGLGATLTYGDMLEAQGMDADDVREQMSAGAGSPGDDEFAETFDGILEAMFAVEMPLEVWVDDDDLVRRIILDMDLTGALSAALEHTGEGPGDGGMSMAMVMDFFDYGDESIEVEIPSDAVDITDEYLALIDGGGLGPATGGPAPGSI